MQCDGSADVLETLQGWNLFFGKSESLPCMSPGDGVCGWNQPTSLHLGVVFHWSSDGMHQVSAWLSVSQEGHPPGTLSARFILVGRPTVVQCMSGRYEVSEYRNDTARSLPARIVQYSQFFSVSELSSWVRLCAH